jgi:O-antigen biosynthesis protein
VSIVKKLKTKASKGMVILKKEGIIGFLRRLSLFAKRIIKQILFGPNHIRVTTAEKIINDRFHHLQPLEYIRVDRATERINIVTDSIGRESLLGGVATSLILGILYANKNKLTLRIVTREKVANPEDFDYFIKMQGLKKPNQVEFYSDYDRKSKRSNLRLESSDRDLYITTSWWSTSVVRDITVRGKIFYLLQEVETFFYPYGDEHYLCSEIMKDESISFMINSSYLWEYYKENGPQNIIKNGLFFEPAFSEALYSPGEKSFEKKSKYSLFFYARPRNSRNLFFYGLKLLNRAIESGLITPNEWDIFFAGGELPQITLSNGVQAKILGQLKWEEYSELIKNIDLGFSLMYTPHPSYPPLDIAASGGVVLTNKFMNKQKLNYSENIILSELDEKNMMDGFKKAIELAKDVKQRKDNFDKNNIDKSWAHNLEPVISFIEKGK